MTQIIIFVSETNEFFFDLLAQIYGYRLDTTNWNTVNPKFLLNLAISFLFNVKMHG